MAFEVSTFPKAHFVPLSLTTYTPYQRLLKSGVLTEDKRRELAHIYGALNPVTLLKQIRESVEHLWTLAER